MTSFEIKEAFTKAVKLSCDLGEISDAHGRAILELAEELGDESWQTLLAAIDHANGEQS
jgi:hypothetical protein